MTTLKDWFNRTVGSWTSERRYLFNLGTKKPTSLTTEFTIAPQSAGDFDFLVDWEGQTEGKMNLKVLDSEIHRDIGYFTEEPTVSKVSLIDDDTIVMSTSYDGMTFREEIRLLYNDTVRLRQTTGTNDRTGDVTIVGQYFEQRLDK